MSRVKRGTQRTKKRKKLLKQAKGFKWGRKNITRLAKTAVTKAGAHAYVGRKRKKRDARRLWQIRINAATREYGLSYSKFMNQLKKAHVELDRKVLADLAANNKKIFAQIIESLKNGK
jgi:large subunit ribosomal protein L20